MTTTIPTNETEAIEENLSIEDVLVGRVASYRLFSRMFFSPLSESELDEFIARDFISMATQFDDNDLLAEGFNDIGRAIRRKNTGTRQQLATDYTMCFDGVETIAGEVAVPYASVFLGEEALLNQEPRHAVYKLYRAEGLAPKTGSLPEDHLSYELEFLASLSEKAVSALEAGDTAEVVRLLDLSEEFINEHILTWFGMLEERANKVLKTRFYKGAFKATRGYLNLDLEIIASLREMLTNE